MASITACIRMLTAVALLAAIQLRAQSLLTLQEAGARRQQDFLPLHEGEMIRVNGQVTAKPIVFKDYVLLPLQDAKGDALILEAPQYMFEKVAAGDVLEVTGLLTHRGGMPVLRPRLLTTIEHKHPPKPQRRTIAELKSPAAVGWHATIEGRVVALGEDKDGEYLLLDAEKAPYPVYMPRSGNKAGTGLSRFRVGDRIRVTGIAAQAASTPPDEGKYRLLIHDAAGVELLERNWLVAPQTLILGVFLLSLLALLRIRQRRILAARRRAVRRLHAFAEDLLTASSSEELLRKLRSMGRRVLGASKLEVYRYDRRSQQLRPLIAAHQPPAPVDHHSGRVTDAPVAVCFRNRTPLLIADTRRSRLLPDAAARQAARSLVLLPMFAQEELVGVMEIARQRCPGQGAHEELPALEHLANLIALMLKLLEQQARKEQLLRSEKLAATGQVLLGVADELKAPLESILALSRQMSAHGDEKARAIAEQSMRAAALLGRLSQAASSESEHAGPVEINALSQLVFESLREELPGEGIRLEAAFGSGPIWAMGVASQLELVLRSLTLLATRSARDSLDKRVLLETAAQGRRAVISLHYGALVCDERFVANANAAAESESLGFSVCRGILQAMGGDVRIFPAGESACRMEITLPAAFDPAARAPQPKEPQGRKLHRAMTAILLEPDAAEQRRLMALWSSHGHRAVPVGSAAEAVELLRRLRVDVVFCSVQVGTSNWLEIFERVRELVPAFVLLVEGAEADAATLFPESDGFLLRKPVEAGEMDRLIEKIERQVESGDAVETR